MIATKSIKNIILLKRWDVFELGICCDVMIATQMIRRGFIPVTTSNPRTKRAETVFVPVGATMGTTAGATAEATMGTTMGTAGYAG